MHTVIVQLWSEWGGLHRAWTFEAANKGAAMTKAMSFCRKGWDMDPTSDTADFSKIQKVQAHPELTYVKLWSNE